MNSARLWSFSFSPSIKECMYSEHTHTKRVCKFIPLWRTGSVGQIRFPDATSSCSVALPQFSAVFLLGENVPLTPPPSPVFSYWLHWPSSSSPLPNTCTSFFGALITLSLHADKCKSFFSFFFSSSFFYFLVQPVPLDRFPFNLCLPFFKQNRPGSKQAGKEATWCLRQGKVAGLTFLMPRSQAEKVLQFSQETNLTALLLEAKELEARVIILSARWDCNNK